ncbi:MAG: hypothetical protein WD226_07395 [Planctomycetota bacterium]
MSAEPTCEAAGAHWDLIVLGSDLEGLAAAAEGARLGLRTLLVGGDVLPGGTAREHTLAPGYVAAGLVDDTETTARALLEPLGLEQSGLAWGPTPPRYGVSGAGTLARVDEDAEVARAFGADNAARLGRWRRWLHRVGPAVLALWNAAPPELVEPGADEALRMAQRAFALRRLGKRDLYELLHTAPQPAWDLAEERFDLGAFGAAWTAPALLGLPHGPRAPGSAALVLLDGLLRGARPIGGPPALARALFGALRRFGGGHRLGLAATRVLLAGGRVRGVALSDGTELSARRVIATEGIARSLRQLFEPAELPALLHDLAEDWRTRGTVSVARYAFERSPFTDLREPVRVVSAPDLRTLEVSVDAHWNGELPAAPAIVFDLDPTGAPGGGAIVTAQVHGARRPAGGWNDARRAQLDRLVRATLADTSGRSEEPVAAEILTPDELEARYGLDGGHLGGGETSLDRLWLRRPHLAVCRYATPIPGFYLGGRAAHPGGPFRGGAGVLAARRAVRDARGE